MNTTTSDRDFTTAQIYQAISSVIGVKLASMVCVFTYQDSDGIWIQSSHMVGDKEIKLMDELK